MAARKYGKRTGDKPYPWLYLIGYRLIEVVFTLLKIAGGALLAYWLAKKGFPQP